MKRGLADSDKLRPGKIGAACAAAVEGTDVGGKEIAEVIGGDVKDGKKSSIE